MTTFKELGKQAQAKDSVKVEPEMIQFSVRLPSHILEALEFLVKRAGVKRNAILNLLVEDNLRDAHIQFVKGLLNTTDMEKVIAELGESAKQDALSQEAIDYLLEG